MRTRDVAAAEDALSDAFATALAEWSDGVEPSFRPVESLRIGGNLLQTWQEAEEREVFLRAVGSRVSRELMIRAYGFDPAVHE